MAMDTKVRLDEALLTSVNSAAVTLSEAYAAKGNSALKQASDIFFQSLYVCLGTEGETQIVIQGLVILSSLLQKLANTWCLAKAMKSHFTCLSLQIWRCVPVENKLAPTHKFCARGQQTFENHTEEKHQFSAKRFIVLLSSTHQYGCKWLEYFYVWQKSIKV